MWTFSRDSRVPCTARGSNQSILTEINPECSLGGPMLKLKVQYFAIWCKESTHWKRPWCWETLKAGGEGDDRTRWLDGIPESMDMSLSKLWETVEDREAWRAVVHGVAESDTTEWLNSRNNVNTFPVWRQRQSLEWGSQKPRSSGATAAGRGEEGWSSRTFRGSIALPASWFHTSSLSSCEKIHFCCSKPPSLWEFVKQP